MPLNDEVIAALKEYRASTDEPETYFELLPEALKQRLRKLQPKCGVEVTRWLHIPADYDPRHIYCSTYCNHGHLVETGMPVNHECRRIPPAALRAEMDGDYELATQLMRRG